MQINTQALAELHSKEYPVVKDIDEKIVKRVFHLAKLLHPDGIFSEQFIEMSMGEDKWLLRYFTDRGHGQDVEFRIFHPEQYYASKTVIIYDNGKIEQDVGWSPKNMVIATVPPIHELLDSINKVLTQEFSKSNI